LLRSISIAKPPIVERIPLAIVPSVTYKSKEQLEKEKLLEEEDANFKKQISSKTTTTTSMNLIEFELEEPPTTQILKKRLPLKKSSVLNTKFMMILEQTQKKIEIDNLLSKKLHKIPIRMSTTTNTTSKEKKRFKSNEKEQEEEEEEESLILRKPFKQLKLNNNNQNEQQQQPQQDISLDIIKSIIIPTFAKEKYQGQSIKQKDFISTALYHVDNGNSIYKPQYNRITKKDMWKSGLFKEIPNYQKGNKDILQLGKRLKL
jgi:hypothetical protein